MLRWEERGDRIPLIAPSRLEMSMGRINLRAECVVSQSRTCVSVCSFAYVRGISRNWRKESARRKKKTDIAMALVCRGYFAGLFGDNHRALLRQKIALFSIALSLHLSFSFSRARGQNFERICRSFGSIIATLVLTMERRL